MRLKKSIMNSGVGVVTFIISFFPVFIVRKVFINTLGTDLLGLTTLFNNIIGYLSIVEMGVGSAIIYSLYKPFVEKNNSKIKAYLKYYEKFYKKVGVIILILGVCMTPYINIFIKNSIDIKMVRVGFLLVLINTVIGYLFTYKHCMLIVAQEGYKISIIFTIGKLVIAVLQIITLKLYGNIYTYILIQILINLLGYIVLNKYIDKQFQWLKNEVGVLQEDEKINLGKNIKALFLHKIGGILVFGTDNIIISAFINLSAVAKYNNYILITNAFMGVIGQAMNGVKSSIGNLLVEGDKSYSYKIHKRLFFFNFWVVSFLVIVLSNTITQFIAIWLGDKYLLDNFTVNIILGNLYFQMMRGSIDQFKDASGEYYRDRFAPLVEGGINLISSIILVKIMGLPGVLMGTVISNISVIFWVKPKIVYKYVFKKPLSQYFKMYFKFMLVGSIPFTLTKVLTENIKSNYNIKAFIVNCLINVVVINITYIIIFRKNKHYIYFKEILVEIMKRKKDDIALSSIKEKEIKYKNKGIKK